MTTEYLGVTCWAGKMVECVDSCCDKHCPFVGSNPVAYPFNALAVVKNYPLYRGSKSNFAPEQCYFISTVS